ncbi:hypothetical protein GWI33_001019 [Rhynchophorus ferrugineus]|uniref:Uncharacterized protein n=1 Tax=Rhynchophorus ferrugineus TaxID=354439 RepID=A0A834M1V8_RHYFE|nr:hypothetical protein GWI33_001020 [Rhynchophorus ferrugineus]KAF7263850.1 hypothetical protein GWI33_001019 [Rhynchophorus ferrugineus]
MLSKVIVFSGLLAVVLCAADEPVAILAQEADIQPDGSFRWSYESADGTKQEQSAVPKQIGEVSVPVLKGSVSWTDADGVAHQVNYVADENGYQPESSDIPVAPEVPAAIARALEWIAAHPSKESES